MIAQPQIQHLNHKLLNKHYVKPSTEDYLLKRELYTKNKQMTLVGFEIGSLFQFSITSKTTIDTTIGLGVAYIDTVTERLAKGFTFIENLSIGISQKMGTSEAYIGTQIGHVSNLDFKQPNDGYNLMGIEIGYRFYLN